MTGRPRQPPPPPSPSRSADDSDLPPPDDEEMPPPDEDEEPPPPDDEEDFDAPPPDDEMPPEEEDDEEEYMDAPPLPDDEDEDAPPPLDDVLPPPGEEDEPDEGFDDEPDLEEEDLPEDFEEDPDPLLDELEDDLPPLPEGEPEDSPPPSPPKSTFILPVSRLAKVSNTDDQSVGQTMGSIDLSGLNLGLAIPPAPQLLRKSIAPPIPPPSLASEKEVSENREVNVMDGAEERLEGEAMKALAKEQGFEPALGKFDMDPFEPLFVKVLREEKRLLVLVGTSQELSFDLSLQAYIFEDTAQDNTIVLDYHKNIILFQFESQGSLISFMKHMPEEVFMAPDPSELEIDTQATQEKSTDKKKPTPKSPTKTSTGPKIEHVKGTSVEDILENDDLETNNRQQKLDQMFSMKEQINLHYPPLPLRKKELVESHIKKPRYSLRRVTLLCQWVNSLHIWPNTLSITTLHKEMCNGVLLSRVIKCLNKEVQFIHLNEKPLAKKAAIDNLDQALGHIWRSKSLNNSRIPTAEEVYGGKTSKIAILLNELYSVYIIRPLHKQAIKILKWYNNVLKQYSRPLPSFVFEEGDLSPLWAHFQSGTALFCILFHFFGTMVIGGKGKERKVDPLKVCGDPSSICEYRDNLIYVFSLLESLEIDVLWTVEDWISFPDTDFILLQLAYIYEKLKLKQCSLPPAQGNTAGISSGPQGELVVVGVVFKDTPVVFSRYLPRTHKAVLLGYDRDSMPLLAIDKGGKKGGRFEAGGILPPGMTHQQGARVSQISKSLKESKVFQKGEWNGRTKVSVEKDTFVGKELVVLLREHHKVGTEGAGGGGGGGESMSVSSLNPSLRGLLGQASQRKEAKKGESAVSPPSSPSAPMHVGELTKEVEEMVRALEEEVGRAYNGLNTTEEALAGRYGELEALSLHLSPEDFSSLFDGLEREREELERERERVEEYYVRKREVIRKKREEGVKRSYAQQQSSLLELSQTLPTSLPLSLTAKDEERRGGRGARGEREKKKSVEEAEKGWISLSSAKVNTHNYLLRNKQEQASLLFQQKITPQHLREGSPPSSLSPTSRTYQKSGRRGGGGEEGVEEAFERFKKRLRIVTERWRGGKKPRRPLLKDLMASTPAAPASPTHIALPEKSFQPPELSREEERVGRAWREMELKCMFYEDERRRMVLLEQSLQASLQDPQENFKESLSPPQSPSPFSLPPQSLPSQPPQPSAVEIEAAFRFLSSPRPLVLCERTQREYIFSLSSPSSSDSSVSASRKGFLSHSLDWKAFSPHSAEEELVGKVVLGDVVNLTLDGEAFTVHIGEKSRALKNSGGRVVLAVRCGGEGEAMKYFNALSILLAVR